jgi:hypothetical protein
MGSGPETAPNLMQKEAKNAILTIGNIREKAIAEYT